MMVEKYIAYVHYRQSS